MLGRGATAQRRTAGGGRGVARALRALGAASATLGIPPICSLGRLVSCREGWKEGLQVSLCVGRWPGTGSPRQLSCGAALNCVTAMFYDTSDKDIFVTASQARLESPVLRSARGRCQVHWKHQPCHDFGCEFAVLGWHCGPCGATRELPSQGLQSRELEGQHCGK
ncbi:unnamed protein product [Coccothraustes coccothraustes]